MQETIIIPPGYGKIRFGRVELYHIAVAVGGLTLAFSLFMYLHMPLGGLTPTASIVFALSTSLVAVLTGFMLHEFAHKVMAQRAGAWAEFRAYPMGLVMAIVTALLGFLLAAPGAVYIQGAVSKKQNGIISLVGPLTNMALGAAFLSLGIVIGSGGFAAALYYIGWINLLLAAFNLLPIPPMDGSKVLAWNMPVYVVSFAGAAGLAAAVMLGLLG